jgi:probable DNA repair protein
MTTPGAGQTTQISGLSTQTLDLESLFARLQAGNTLVTGNSRLARVLTGQYSLWRIGLGDRQWERPAIVSWNLWIDQLWERASLGGFDGADRAVPGNRQLASLWENVLKTEPLPHKLLRPESLGNQLSETRKLVVEWQLDMRDAAWFGSDNENHTCFSQWNRAFERLCKENGWISPEDRTVLLREALNSGLLPSAAAIDLLGFDEFNPVQAGFLAAMIESDCAVCRLTITPRDDKAVLFRCDDNRHELLQMARWVRYWIEKEPNSRIAVVVPDLATRRQAVERHLQDILTPARDDRNPQVRPWNFSLGIPLIRVPLVSAAFDLLKMLDKRIDIQDVGRVLRSPWLRGASLERNGRALLEKCLRDNYPRQLTLNEVKYRATELKKHDSRHNELPQEEWTPAAWNCPELSRALNQLARFERNSKGSRSASAWAEAFDQLLAGLGWPMAEGRPQDHDQTWQALQKWNEALHELASLEVTTAAMNRKTAIRHLLQVCREKIFQEQTAPAPIQVLGLYEINGLRFDHLWVLGLHNDNWPPAARPNPFIPGRLQKVAQIPHSSPQRELEVARTVTRRLLESAPDCIFSYPAQLDGEDVLPSPLLDFDEVRADDKFQNLPFESWCNVVAAASKPEIGPLDMPGALVHGTATGGSSILKHQALCPFRAFASNRLGADILLTPADGISPLLHGSLVHRVLEHFWQEVRTQSALLEMDEETLHATLQRHVDQVMGEDRGLKLRPAFRGVEADRVQRHVLDFLEQEKEREAFEVIGFEQEILPELQGQSIRLIIDRIDRLPAGEEVIIDYKTGKVDPSKWFGDRPEDPQLPLYAISAESMPAAVVFSVIRDDGCHYKGVVQRPGILPGLPKTGKSHEYLLEAGENMPETIGKWREVLHHLMADFLAGEAAVDPKNGLKTCENSYCELHSLCRVGELDQRSEAISQQESPA